MAHVARHHRGDPRAADAAVLDERMGDAGGRGRSWCASTCSSSRRSRSRCRWSGTCCSPTRPSSCSGASRPGTATRCGTCPRRWLTVVVRRGAAVLPDPGQLPARQGVVPAVHAAVRRQLGVRGVGVRPGRRGQAQQGRRAPPRTRSTSSSISATSRSGPMSRCNACHLLAHHAQPGPRPVLGAAEERCPDIDTRTVREGEFVCNSLIGFNFGDGHLHDEDLIAAVQREAAFEPGELVVVWVESQAWGSKVQHYKVIDAALGVIERGTWTVTDAVAEQPWLPNGPIPTEVTWSLDRQAASQPVHDHGATWREHYRGRRGGRAQRPGRRGRARQGRRRGDRAGSRRRDRRRHPHQRGDRARPAARPLLGDPSDGRRLAISRRARPGAATGCRWRLPGDRLRPSARRRQRGRAVPLGRGDRRRAWATTAPAGARLFDKPSANFDALAEDIMGPLLQVPHHPV